MAFTDFSKIDTVKELNTVLAEKSYVEGYVIIIWKTFLFLLFSLYDHYDELILWSVFMTGSKTPGMSDTEDVIDFTISDFDILGNTKIRERKCFILLQFTNKRIKIYFLIWFFLKFLAKNFFFQKFN